MIVGSNEVTLSSIATIGNMPKLAFIQELEFLKLALLVEQQAGTFATQRLEGTGV